MSDYISYTATAKEQNGFLSRTYRWMALALIISAASAFVAANSVTLLKLLFGYHSIGFFALCIAELGIVWYASARISSLSVAAVRTLFVVYSVINGVTLCYILLIYQLASVAQIFIGTAAMFAVMSLYGIRTKTNLASAGRYLMMGVIGIIVMSVVNLLIGAITGAPISGLSWIISLATVVIFAGLTAYDSQKLLAIASQADNSEAFQKLAIYGALDLYLDFINIFLALLRLFGKRR